MRNQPFSDQPFSRMQSSNNKTFGCIFMTLCLLYCVLVLILPVVDLVYATQTDNLLCEPVKYVNSSNTTNGTIPPGDMRLGSSIGIKTWLVIHGSIGICETFIVLSAFCFGAAEAINDIFVVPWCLSSCFVAIIMMFRFAWIVVGFVMFYRDCYKTEPRSVNDLMWATLIIGIIGLWTSSGVVMSKKK